MKRRNGWTYRVILLLLAVWPGVATRAQQQAETPGLDAILAQLESNLQRYQAQVPSFFSSERVISQMDSMLEHQKATTDSVFRLKRQMGTDGKETLVESREVKTIDGAPAAGDAVGGPSYVTGAFSGGLSIVSLDQRDCMRYTLKPIKAGHPKDPYVVQFVSVPGSESMPHCLLHEEGNGQVSIDPTTMEITKMQLTVPEHILVRGGKTPEGYTMPTVVGVWDLSVDYAPVELGGQSFWMPATIGSTIATGFGPSQRIWTYKAHYTDYHKLEVTTRILPTEDAPKP